jgi:RNA polymerase-associated protein
MIQTAHTRTVLTLFTAPDDVQSHRVRLVLAAKGVVYDRVEVPPGKPHEELLSINPYGDTPTLQDRDMVLYEPDVVCEYIDERYPHPPLMPVDPLSRALLRLAIVRIENDWLTLVDRIEEGGRPAEAAQRALRDDLVRNLPAFKASKFFLSPEMSLADCALAPLVWRLDKLGIDLPREARAIRDYGERIFRNPGFTRSLTSEEKALRP